MVLKKPLSGLNARFIAWLSDFGNGDGCSRKMANLRLIGDFRYDKIGRRVHVELRGGKR